MNTYPRMTTPCSSNPYGYLPIEMLELFTKEAGSPYPSNGKFNSSPSTQPTPNSIPPKQIVALSPQLALGTLTIELPRPHSIYIARLLGEARFPIDNRDASLLVINRVGASSLIGRDTSKRRPEQFAEEPSARKLRGGRLLSIPRETDTRDSRPRRV